MRTLDHQYFLASQPRRTGNDAARASALDMRAAIHGPGLVKEDYRALDATYCRRVPKPVSIDL